LFYEEISAMLVSLRQETGMGGERLVGMTAEEKLARSRAMQRLWRARNAERVKECQAAWRARNPGSKKREAAAERARGRLQDAVKAHKLRQLPCEGCGETEAVQGHHYDYMRPLDVIWLCGRCHGLYHTVERRIADLRAIASREGDMYCGA
jgi:hypothetical protein